jgi:threonine dehydratase
VLSGTTTDERAAKAREICETEGMTFVPPYDDATIIAGQATVGLEIVADLPDVETVLVPVGGGGLSAGVSTAVKLLAPNARVIGVEPTTAQSSAARGRRDIPCISRKRAGLPMAFKLPR